MMLRLLMLLLFLPFAAVAQPNVVFILVDDMSMNMMDPTVMPNLAQMQADGVTFENHYVTESLCCPSRASILTGMLPHNTGVHTNEGPQGGHFAWLANGNEARSLGVILQTGGYKTAFMGKYLNGWKADDDIPPGWNKWVATDHGYQGFGYTLNNNGILSLPPEHFNDTISNLGKTWINNNRQPFFIELASFSPHSPYVPAARHEFSFLDKVLPTTPAWDSHPTVAAPAWLQSIPDMKAALKNEIRARYIDRLQTMASVDEMIGSIRQKLANTGMSSNTYIIFTSDNGYHMGEFSLRPGKTTPFDFDIKVPMIIVGPGITPGSVSSRITSHVDIFPTILEWAGLSVPTWIDGRSMFTGAARTLAVVEHLQVLMDPADPDYNEPKAGDPPTYTALRGDGFMYVEYATGEVGYYTDTHQMVNSEAGLTAVERTRLHDAVAAVQGCAGATCQAAQDR